MPALPNNTVVAGYRIDGPLGEGGMGTVYRATQLSLERVVALKLLTSDLSGDAGFRERFRREGLLQAALDHPHIVTVYEAGSTEYGLFLAMRVVDGPTLKKLIQTKQQGDRRSLRLLTQVAEALDAAHVKGLIHRDVKPQNVLVGAGDHAYLADFGLTRGAGDEGVTETGHFVGTIDYISPEQARGELATPQSDIYALTAVLYECLTGQVPYVRATEERVLLAHLAEEPPRVTDLRADLPPAIDDVVARGMAKDPDDRPRTCSDLMLEARRALGAPGPVAHTSAADATRLGTVTPTQTADEDAAGATRMAGAVTLPAGAPTAPARPRAAGAGAGTAADTGERTRPRGAGAAPQRRGRGGPLIALAVLAVIVAAAIGVLAGKPSSAPPAPGFTNNDSVGDLAFSYPSSWRQLPSATAIPGLQLTQSLELASVPSAHEPAQTLIAGESTANGPSLLPDTLTKRLIVALGPPDTVRIGTIDAYRYSFLKVRGVSETLTVLAIPTSSGVATIVCMGAPVAPGATVGATCQQVAATLRLNGATAYPLSPSTQYASALSVALSTLNSKAAAGAAALGVAASGHAQAAAAERIAAAYTSGASAIAKLTVSPAIGAINARVASSLSRLALDYTALSRAAAAADRHSYAAASKAAAADSVSLKKSLGSLRSAGYAVSG